MNVAKVKYISELPPEFCLENYARLAEIGPDDWGALLALRLEMKLLMDDHQSQVSQCIALLAKPLAHADGRGLGGTGRWNKYTFKFGCVASANVGVARDIERALKGFPQEFGVIPKGNLDSESIIRYYREREQVFDDAGGPIATEPFLRLGPRGQSGFNFSTPQRVVTVDIGASDEEIVRDFSSWLQAMRAQGGYVRKTSGRGRKAFSVVNSPPLDTQFRTWIRYRVVPLVDLRLWARSIGRELSWSVLERALFADFDGATYDAVRRTAKRHADCWFTVRMFYALFTLAAKRGAPAESGD